MKAIFAILPLFAGLFAVTAKPAPINLEIYLGRYIAFILLVVVWGVFRASAIRLLTLNKLTGSKKVGAILGVAALAVLTIAMNFLFKKRFEDEAYQLALLSLGFAAFWSRYLYLKRYSLAAFWGVLADTIVGFLSFQVVLFEWQWQPLVYSIPFACASVLVSLLSIDDTNEEKKIPQPLKKILFALMPASIGLMVVAGALSGIYLLTFIFLLMFEKITHQQAKRILLASIALFFIMLAGLGLTA